ncbi:transposase [Nitrosomonas communis]|uniref:Transposase n=1 Tax=Nitrosomonas communis TaxID=44574 RepID=A0A1I4NVG7_9PROT|nr:transposase [Nitrosomonas communis]SFM19287.1 Transposase [Nitrosomonas communis]
MRWIKTPGPKTTRNKPATKIDMEILAQDVKNYPDAYQYERAKRLGVSTQDINHALKRLGVAYKKSLRHPKASEEERRIFQQKIEGYEKAALSFISFTLMKAALLTTCHARMAMRQWVNAPMA